MDTLNIAGHSLNMGTNAAYVVEMYCPLSRRWINESSFPQDSDGMKLARSRERFLKRRGRSVRISITGSVAK